ncbi:MAG: hypothetical protein VX366_07250 [Candidatus Thermoplasmatota archaeon]|nr:hypothetical protein [Candidatus Thermoplasmatota archaeon]
MKQILSIESWQEICSVFSKMFSGLGEIETNSEIISYRSISPYVATGISVNKQGIIIANMPLHNIQSSFDYVEFDEKLESVRLFNDTSSYEYRIPPQILELRK